MLILLSPAKTLDMDTPSRVAEPTMPAFMEDSAKLVDTLQGYSESRLSELMHISDALASLNAGRFSSWQPNFDTNNARPCIQAFRGDVYVGLDADTLDEDDLHFAQSHLRILSGLYGVMRPLDLMQAYRLEMGTSLETDSGKSLYEFWGERLTAHLNSELDGQENTCVINLASNEYFKSIKPVNLRAPLISPVFKDEKKGNYKIISFFAKKARGTMARNLIKTRAAGLDDVLGFTDLGYRFDEQSSSEGQPVFLRSEEAARPYLA